MIGRMVTRRIEHTNPEGKLLTLDQIAAFVQDAMRSGATGAETVDASISFGGCLKKIGVKVKADSAKGATA